MYRKTEKLFMRNHLVFEDDILKIIHNQHLKIKIIVDKICYSIMIYWYKVVNKGIFYENTGTMVFCKVHGSLVGNQKRFDL
jgi:hypothetical protein